MVNEAIVSVKIGWKMPNNESYEYQQAVMWIAEGRLKKRLYMKQIELKKPENVFQEGINTRSS
jgi:hypothetical protein